MNTIHVDTLAEFLRDAEKAHADYEKNIGGKDADWPRWYASYLTKRFKEVE